MKQLRPQVVELLPKMLLIPQYCTRHTYNKKLCIISLINFLLKCKILNFTNVLFEILKMIHNI